MHTPYFKDIPSMNRIIEASKRRETKFELLRILAMFLIVAHHFMFHGGFDFSSGELTFNSVWYGIMNLGGKIGLNIFMILSGYFLYKEKDQKLFDLRKVLRFWLQIFFYSVIIFVIDLIINKSFNASNLLHALLPISFGTWQYVSAYFVILLVSPFINILIRKLDKKSFLILIVILLSLWTVMTTLTASKLESNYVIWMVVLYFVGSYIRVYGFPFNIKKFKASLILLFVLLFMLASYCFISLLSAKHQFLVGHEMYFYDMQRIPAVIASILIFYLFYKSNFKSNWIINIISICTFGVFLIHDHYIVRELIWKSLFKNALFQNNPLLPLYSLGVCITVFSACLLVEFLRKITVENLFEHIYDSFLKRRSKDNVQ